MRVSLQETLGVGATSGLRPKDRKSVSLVRVLCESLGAEGVSHCHWKSTAFLERSATAENDLDLLVDRADASRLGLILHRLGFKEARAPRATPGVADFYGYDGDAERFVHVHVHYQLVVGDDATKNYRLPLEDAFLASATSQGIFHVPSPELELVAFVIRMVLKHATWDALLTRQGRLPDTARQELEHLLAGVDHDRLGSLLRAYLPSVDATLFADCIRALASGCGAWARLRTGHRLLVRLKPYARRPRSLDIGLKFWRRGVGFLARRLFRALPLRAQLVSGGAMIAVVGGDGAGKSTAVGDLQAWLSRDFRVRRVHLGRPPQSAATSLIRTMFKVRMRLARGRSTSPGALRVLLDLGIARDRWSAYLGARRFANRGGIVVCDRFPLRDLASIDGPRLANKVGAHRGRLLRLLLAIEQRYFAGLTSPDVLIALLIDPDVAVQRRPDERPDFVRQRCEEFSRVAWGSMRAHVIDAGRPLPEVRAAVQRSVWSSL